MIWCVALKMAILHRGLHTRTTPQVCYCFISLLYFLVCRVCNIYSNIIIKVMRTK